MIPSAFKSQSKKEQILTCSEIIQKNTCVSFLSIKHKYSSLYYIVKSDNSANEFNMDLKNLSYNNSYKSVVSAIFNASLYSFFLLILKKYRGYMSFQQHHISKSSRSSAVSVSKSMYHCHSMMNLDYPFNVFTQR